MSGPFISVIMPVYNTEQFLDESIQSILSQTYTNFEFIIINDGSSDNSEAIVKKYIQKDNRLKYISQKNKGVAAAMNTAIAATRGGYIARSDSDDISLPNKLADLVKTLTRYPSAIVVCGSYEVIDESGKNIDKVTVPIRNADLKRAFSIRNPIGNGATLVKKSAIQEVGGIKEVFAEDCYLWKELFGEGDFIGTGTTVYKWRTNSSGLTHTNKRLSDEKEREYTNSLWPQIDVSILNRKSLLDGIEYYNRMGGHEYADVFIRDICRLSIQCLRHGMRNNFFRQNTILMTLPARYKLIAIDEIRLLLRRNALKLIKK